MPEVGERKVRRDGLAYAEWNGQGWVEHPVGTGKQQKPEASLDGRLSMGLAPMVRGHERMVAEEQRGNPFSLRENPGNALAEVMSNLGLEIPQFGVDWHPLAGVAKAVGGDDYQRYQQGRKAFEAQLMPIQSGAAVSPSEAARQREAALPELGDSPANLAEKDRNRMMLLNGAAKAKGLPLPYPGVATWGINDLGPPASGGQGRVRRYNPASGRIE